MQTYKPLSSAAIFDSTKVELLEVMFTRTFSSLLQDSRVEEDRFPFPQQSVTLLPSSNVLISVTFVAEIKH